MAFERLAVIVVCTIIVLILLERLWYAWCSTRGRRVTRRTSPHAGDVPFALKEGQTIVGVSDEHNAVCFYVARDVREKDYE